MNIVYIHIGPTLPAHLKYSLEQTRKWYSGDVWLLMNRDAGIDFDPLALQYDVKGVFLEKFQRSELIERFEAISFLHEYGQFWDVTMRRLMYLEEFIKDFGLQEVIHIENDILIYSDPDQMECFPRKFAVNAISQKYAGYGYCMMRSWRDLKTVNRESLAIMSEGRTILEARYGEGMVNEMLIAGELVQNGIAMALPTLPSQGVKFLYDGSAWGQYVGGTTNDPPGWKEGDRYVGEYLRADLGVVKWCVDSKGRKFPSVYDKATGLLVPLANLHIHSKNLKDYMS